MVYRVKFTTFPNAPLHYPSADSILENINEETTAIFAIEDCRYNAKVAMKEISNFLNTSNVKSPFLTATIIKYIETKFQLGTFWDRPINLVLHKANCGKYPQHTGQSKVWWLGSTAGMGCVVIGDNDV